MEAQPPDRKRPEKRREIIRVSLLLIAITVATKILAYVVQAKKASYFGIGPVVDCYEWAIFFPTLIYSFASNVLNVLLVPIFSGRRSSRSFERAYQALVTWSLAGFLIIGLLLLLLAPLLVSWFSDFEDADRRMLAVLFLSILACGTFFIGIEGVQSGFLLAEKRVLSVAVVRLLKEVVFVGVMIFGFAHLAEKVLPGGWLMAAAFGGIVFFLLGFRHHRFSFRLFHVDDYIRALFRNLWPVLVLFGLININELVRVKLLSAQPGDLSTYRYAYYIFLLPHVLVAENLVLFLFPLMAAEVNQGDLARLRHSVRSGVKLMTFLILPAAIGLIVLAEPIVRLLYERRQFGSEDTRATTLPLIFLCIGMWAFSLHVLFARTLDALQAYWRRVAVETPFVILSIALNWWLIRRFGYSGAAWATTVSFAFLLALEIWQVRRCVETIHMRLIRSDLLRIGLATVAMAICARLTYACSGALFASQTMAGQAGRLGLAILVALIAYFLCSLGLKIIRKEDLAQLRDYLLLRRLSEGGNVEGWPAE